MKKGGKILLYAALLSVALYFFLDGLVRAQSFLVPLSTAMVLAFLVFPIAGKLEKLGLNKVLSSLTSTLMLLIVATGFVFIIFHQIRGFADDWEEVREGMEEKFEEFNQYLIDNTPLEHFISLSPEETGYEHTEDYQAKETKEEVNAVNSRGYIMTAMSAVLEFLTNILVICVYIFLFIHFRGRFKEFILRFFPHDRRDKVAYIISRSSSASRRYLAGKLLLMVFLALLYFTGLFISGLENALLISLISAALSIIPIVGNLIGYFLAMAVSLLTDGGTGTLIGITLTFAIAQFIDTYVLQPIILGDKLNVHPFFIILSVILGYELWGIMGMVLAIPLFAIITVVCRHVPGLDPFGYLFSKSDAKDIKEDGK